MQRFPCFTDSVADTARWRVRDLIDFPVERVVIEALVALPALGAVLPLWDLSSAARGGEYEGAVSHPGAGQFHRRPIGQRLASCGP